ncbi:riboflavin synthase [Sphingosinicella sp. CPCC 101087]|uniref:riboflavin synthase n=1 Tax=Sphingosinicella sp. CPCC 101087 TaxID=2497754 RepID=UPI00101C09FC|nr:riboflavin synthase [Sphingosinicella sp. CPCC 101087]
MFTGIITDVGTIEAIEARGDLRVRVGCGYDMATVDLGASIACSGVCLTVVDKSDGWFAVDVSAETRARAAPSMWSQGRRLNLERALKVGDELGGHIVTGHVDGVGEVEAATPEGDSLRLAIVAGAAVAPYVAAKGSIALDGVSLTVNEVESLAGGAVRFGINVIPHTAAQTTFGGVRAGDRLNIEIDILARYLGRMLEARSVV